MTGDIPAWRRFLNGGSKLSEEPAPGDKTVGKEYGGISA
jgi:hypothetical protein